MNINDFYSDFFHQKPLELYSSSYSGASSCTFLVDGTNLTMSAESEVPFVIDRKQATIELTYKTETFEVKVIVSIARIELLKFEGSVIEVTIRSSGASLVDKFCYLIAGSESYPLSNNFAWERNYKINGNTYDVNYVFIESRIEARISNRLIIGLDAFEKLSQLIEDEVFIVCLAYSFCRSTKVEWVEKKLLSDKTFNSYHYIHSNAPYKYSNLINPMRNDSQAWDGFIKHVISNKYKKEDFINNQVFQAISNLIWNGKLNEWTLISHVAALEGLCKNNVVKVVKDRDYKKARDCAISCLRNELIKLGVDDESIIRIRQNICDNERSLNGFPTKWYVERALESNNLKQFSQKNLKSINLAIQMRNKIVHEGWSNEWKLDIYDYIKILRETIYVLVLAYYDYDGCFYLLDSEKKVALAEYA